MEKTLILMSDNRPPVGDVFYTSAAIVNYNYAIKHGYDFKYFVVGPCYSSSGHERHPAWGKILSVLKAFKYFKYDRIVYIDTDCVFENQELSIDEYLNTFKNTSGKKIKKSADLFFLNNYPYNVDEPCSGFFVAKKESIDIFNDWHKVDSNYDNKHPWEQRSLSNYIYPKWKNRIEIIDDIMFERNTVPQFLMHLTSDSELNRNMRNDLFKNIIKDNDMKYGVEDLDVFDFTFKSV
jgi:hypothetical protein